MYMLEEGSKHVPNSHDVTFLGVELLIPPLVKNAGVGVIL